jgi:sn1-specific diacylglycerol lipase
VLLSYMLRSKFPTLRCIAYSPAGCTFTWELATRCNEWTTTCVLDSDIVPRLSVDAIRELRDEVLDIVGRIKVPKYEVARRLVPPQRCLRWLECSLTGAGPVDVADQEEMVRESLSDILHDRDDDDLPQYEYHRQVARFHQIQSERKSQRFEARLYPPGRILLIAKTGELKSCTADMAKCLTCCTSSFGSSYGPVWVDNDQLNEIVVSPTMGTDHFPTRIRTILERVADECNSSGKHL